ncbi:MAG: hypothetical protein NTU53_01725 [Planctomycetota bacterium]|nr:hypothetical protein [Planctomycetota bacterium]
MNDPQDQHDASPRPATPPVPILDYGRPQPVIFLGQPLQKTVRQLLVVELVLLLLASVMLDAGAMMMLVTFFFILFWLGLIVCLLIYRIRLPLRQRIEILIGIVLAAAGTLLVHL